MTDMPHSLEAETSLLGAMLLSSQAIDVSGQLSADDFYRTAHGIVFDAIQRVAAKGTRPDQVTVLEQLVKDGRLAEVGGNTSLSELSASCPNPSNAASYAAEVADCSRRRRIAEAASRLTVQICDRSKDADVTVDEATRAMLDRDGTDGIVTVDDLWDGLSARLAETQHVEVGAGTGWPSMDRIWRVVPGTLTVVTGAPGSGKSQWVDCLAVNLADHHDWKVALFSPEQGPADDHAWRLAWSYLGGDPHRMSKSGYADKVSEGFDWLGSHVRWIDDLDSRTVPSILARARTIRSRWGLDLLVIDPWNKVELDRSAGLRDDLLLRDVLADIVTFARRTGIHVIVVAHPTKLDFQQGSGSRTRVPTVYDIAGGAEWNNQADSVLSVWRDVAGEQDDPAKVQIRAAKVRRQGPDGFGQVAGTELWFDQMAMRYGRNQPLPREVPA